MLYYSIQMLMFTPCCLIRAMSCVCLCNIFSSFWTSKCYGPNQWSRHGTSGGDPPSGGLTTSYSVTISNCSYTTSPPVVMTNGSAMVTFTGLRNDSSYNISAVAINCAGNSSTSIQRYISCMYTGLVQLTSVCMM